MYRLFSALTFPIHGEGIKSTFKFIYMYETIFHVFSVILNISPCIFIIFLDVLSFDF